MCCPHRRQSPRASESDTWTSGSSTARARCHNEGGECSLVLISLGFYMYIHICMCIYIYSCSYRCGVGGIQLLARCIPRQMPEGLHFQRCVRDLPFPAFFTVEVLVCGRPLELGLWVWSLGSLSLSLARSLALSLSLFLSVSAQEQGLMLCKVLRQPRTDSYRLVDSRS